MFCHLEIHWGALGRRNIAPVPPEASHWVWFFYYVLVRSDVEPQNPAHMFRRMPVQVQHIGLTKQNTISVSSRVDSIFWFPERSPIMPSEPVHVQHMPVHVQHICTCSAHVLNMYTLAFLDFRKIKIRVNIGSG